MAFVYHSTSLKHLTYPVRPVLSSPQIRVKPCSPAVRTLRFPLQMRSKNSPTVSQDIPDEVPEVISDYDEPSDVDSEISEPAQVTLESTSGNGGAPTGNGGDDNGGNGRRDEDDNEENSDPPVTKQAPVRIEEPIVSQVAETADSSKGFDANIAETFEAFFRAVPAPIVVALISVSSTISAARFKSHRDEEKEEKKAHEAARKNKQEIEHQLRKSYSELAGPILKSAVKLAERIYTLVDSDYTDMEADVHPNMSPVYSAYLLGRYLASVEIIKQESSVMDFGFPAADRIFANVLGRVQGVLSADDKRIHHMQKIERFFKPKEGEAPLDAGPLRLAPRDQSVLGELLLRRIWMDKYDFIDQQDSKQDATVLTRGPKAVMSFWEFTRVLQQNEELSRWYQPVINEFTKIEHFVQKTPKEERRGNELGARLYFLQASLMDLVDFFDPMPSAKTVPFYRRNRLQLGHVHHDEEQRMPMSLNLLYRELSRLRDHRVLGGDKTERLRLPHGVEVYVKASQPDFDGPVLKGEMGDCPFSHRVLIVLREMGIAHKLVAIPYDAKPSWFHLLHPENSTPVMYHEGKLVEDSMQIVSYLFDHFPGAKKLSSSDDLEMLSGDGSFTRFHNHFSDWLAGNERSRLELDKELKCLDRVLSTAQSQNGGQPFLGGSCFSREDTAIAPMLNNIEVAGRVIRGWNFPSECHALRKYLDAARKVTSFSETAASEQVIVSGYDRLMKMGGKKPVALASMLE